MTSDWTKNISKNIFLKSSLEFVSSHFQANETINTFRVRHFSDWILTGKICFWKKIILRTVAYRNGDFAAIRHPRSGHASEKNARNIFRQKVTFFNQKPVLTTFSQRAANLGFLRKSTGKRENIFLFCHFFIFLRPLWAAGLPHAEDASVPVSLLLEIWSSTGIVTVSIWNTFSYFRTSFYHIFVHWGTCWPVFGVNVQKLVYIM